jgi:hypothetical protein
MFWMIPKSIFFLDLQKISSTTELTSTSHDVEEVTEFIDHPKEPDKIVDEEEMETNLQNLMRGDQILRN